MKKIVSRARPLWLAAVSLALSLHVAASQAQFSAVELQPVTVTGSRTPRTLGSDIAPTSVLTRSDIEHSGARDAVSVLNMLGTALVEQQGGPGTAAVVRIRGADSRDTLVLIDGVPLTDVTTGQASLSQIPAEFIDRVEVVRGNLSALYGANATGGVIQIFTRRSSAGGFAPQVGVGAGSHGTRALNASVAAGDERLSGRISAGVERSDGFSAANPAVAPNANPDADGNRRRYATLAVDAQLATGQRIGLDLRTLDGKAKYDSTSQFSASTDTHEQHLVQHGATLRGEHRLGSAWTLAWRSARADEKRTDSSLSAGGPFSFGNVLHNQNAAVDLNGRLASGWGMQFGVERLVQWTDNATYTRNGRDTDILRLGGTYDAPWGALQANVRHDQTSDFGSAISGLLGGRVVIGRGVSAIASVSNSFTPPTLDFLFYDCSPFSFVCSNPDLQPEKGRTAALGVQWQDTRTLARATLFAARYRDKIANDASGVPQNLQRTKNDGIELSVRTRVARWSLGGEATLQNPVNEATGQRLLRRTRQQFAARADHDAGHWGAGVGLRYVGNRPDSLNGNAQQLPSSTLVDASVRWTPAPDWAVQATVDNLFDRHHQPTAGYNGRPRTLFVGLRWQPKL